jgi:hypothetical protein
LKWDYIGKRVVLCLWTYLSNRAPEAAACTLVPVREAPSQSPETASCNHLQKVSTKGNISHVKHTLALKSEHAQVVQRDKPPGQIKETGLSIQCTF